MTHNPLFGADHGAVLENWNRRGFADRCRLLASLTDHLPLSASRGAQRLLIGRLLDRAHHLDQPELMPGPTGESNELYASGRGDTLVYGAPCATQTSLLGQLITALGCGNSVVLCSEAETEWCEQLVAILHQLGVPRGVLIWVEAPLEQLLELPSLALVAAVIEAKQQMRILRQLAERSGVLVQLVAETDPHTCSSVLQPDHLLRFVTEKTRTINTTAVGGNASLLELGGSAH